MPALEQAVQSNRVYLPPCHSVPSFLFAVAAEKRYSLGNTKSPSNMSKELERWILDAVQSHDGQWNWWHMDRALASQGKVDWLSQIISTIERLVQSGFIAYVERSGVDPAIKCCKLTPAGLHALHG